MMKRDGDGARKTEVAYSMREEERAKEMEGWR